MSITIIEGGIMGLRRSSESTVTGVANIGGSMDHAAQAQVFLKQSDEEFAGTTYSRDLKNYGAQLARRSWL